MASRAVRRRDASAFSARNVCGNLRFGLAALKIGVREKRAHFVIARLPEIVVHGHARQSSVGRIA
jgi:hypothetical protein